MATTQIKNGFHGGSDDQLLVNTDGSINVSITGTGTSNVSVVSNPAETSGTSAVTQVNASITSVSLLAANANRKAAAFYNASTAIAYLKLGTTASTASYTLQMQPNSFFVVNFDPIYTGEVDCIWSAANGVMAITELT